MSPDPPRMRAVSSTTAPSDDEIANIVSELKALNLSTWEAYRDDLTQAGLLQQLRYKLKDLDASTNPQDSFRRAQGLQVLSKCIRSLAEIWTKIKSEKEIRSMIQTLAQFLLVLEAALIHHAGNNRYFRKRVEGGGWTAIHQYLLVFQNTSLQRRSNDSFLEQFYGVLLAAAVGDEALSTIFTSAAKACPPTGRSWDLKSADLIQVQIERQLQNVTDIAMPDLLPIMVKMWAEHLSRVGKSIQTINLAFPISLKVLMNISRQNIVEAHTTGLLSAVIPLLFDGQHTLVEKSLYRELGLLLCQEGVTNLDDAYFFFSKASTSMAASSFLLEAIRISRQPASIQFDLSRYGSSSIELPTLRKVFPPSDSDGYTISMWARFDSFDPEAHTTLFGACDKTQTCFVLAYLEKDSHHLILQTAIKGSRPSVRFRSVKFDTATWYHICIVHKKPRVTSSSKASLFINGLFVEQIKTNFPMTPPSENSSTPKVQAFLGTPQDLAPDTSSPCSSLWSLASAVLFGIALNEDLIAVMFHLGPTYHGNMQDCLGSFQTYDASAALNFRNESLNAGNEQSSQLSIAIRQKGSSVLSEDAILLNISPAAVLDNDDRNNIDESQLIRSLSKTAAKNLSSYIRAGANAVVINGAVPAINDALVQANGVAMLMGEPVVTVPQSLENASWRLGGCAPGGLSLIAKARTTEEVSLAVDILLETVQKSWRNSEVMERNNGYSILSSLLRDKLVTPSIANSTSNTGQNTLAIPTPNLDRGGLAVKVLKSILSFLGYNNEDPARSMIINPLAYKILLIDNSVWRNHHFETQELYFKQFTVFAKDSVHMKFNLKRLSRMRALRRLLEALKSENVLRSTMPSYSAALSALLSTATSAEMLRSIALFITYSVHKRNTTGRFRKSARSRASSGTGSVTPTGENPNLTQFEIGVEILKLYSDMLCAKNDLSMIKKFARTVTNKWLLYLFSETSPEVIVLSMQILARLLVVHGEAYVKKFKDKSGGFTIIAHRLKRWWHIPALWPACFAILFDVDVAELDLDRSFDLFSFVDLFNSKKDYGIVYPEMFEVICGMLQSGLKTIVSAKDYQPGLLAIGSIPTSNIPERLSMSTMAPPNPLLTLVTPQNIDTFNTIVRFLSDLQTRSSKFREYVSSSSSSSYVQELLFVLFPVVVGADVVDASVELDARDSTLSFNGTDVVVQPLSARPPIIRAVEQKDNEKTSRGDTLHRGTSFVLISKEAAHHDASQDGSTVLANSAVLATQTAENNVKHAIVQSILEIVVSLFVDQILSRKDFIGLGLFSKTPPGFVEHQTFFESWILRNTVSQLANGIALNQSALCEPKVLTNLARFLTQLGDAIFEGWFLGGSESVIDLASNVLEYLQRPEISRLKSVRLCAQPISIIRAVVFRVELLSLSHVETTEMLALLKKLAYWQNVLLSPAESQSNYLQLLCYLLYGSLIADDDAVRGIAADLWRTTLVQKPNETAAILGLANTADQKRTVNGFEKLIELDNATFLVWVDNHREELDSLFFGTLSKSWNAFVKEENDKTEDSSKARVGRRKEKLKTWSKNEKDREELLRRHDITFEHWTANIHSSETLKHQRLVQDQQDDLVFTNMAFARIQRELACATGLFDDGKPRKWRVDQTEGRNRMRMRLIEDQSVVDDAQPKRKGSDVPALRLDTKELKISTLANIGPTPIGDGSVYHSPHPTDPPVEPFPDVPERSDTLENIETEESFELVEDPNAGQDDFEDKNRKVMRSLHRGDQVKHVANISRIAGLEAVEGLLILGKEFVYLMDNFFQRADGEIVHVWQAPPGERDSYVGVISGRDISTQKPTSKDNDHQCRSWKWSDVISISKRRFLFRDVALEMFFGDGRSYLLTVVDPKTRNELYSLVSARAPQYGNPDTPQSEVAWRYETLKSAEDEPQTIGARFASVFAQLPSLTATRKWQKGEMSNFHYLMLINTLAGRTYNDLTQYPVFPWVIADYTSEELDLEKPQSFRDLSKPMGCQHPDREAEFRERYKQFAHMGDSNAPPFHYGTHYSSAMIVTSYLIRLQPFVKSYLLLQGGTFDHPDRLFYSIEGAWKSASQTNMTDVRELTPEFFYLPEFLTNPNSYDFGMRQNSTKSIGNVTLPPWAKGDPKVFIAKQRQALESPYVSRYLHKWIDLVFGCKQKGDAAVNSVNVFHHLSYQGARDLDAIDDPVERLATIGIIHNFGQTPHQVFHRAHPAREQLKHKYKRLDTATESLTRIPGTLLDSEERVASITHAVKADKLLCSGAFRLNIPPTYDKYMEWGFSDNSIRFYATDNRKQIGLFEHLHIGQLSCALFGDSKTLITAGTDCTVAVWAIHSTNNKSIDLHPRATLFGHRATVTHLALSRSFNALLSCSSNGELIMWDLNRCEFVRRIAVPGSLSVECVTVNDVTGNVVVCHGPWITVFTLNGELLISQDTSDSRSSAEDKDTVVSVACYEGAGTEWLERDILFTGHRRGVVKVWSLVVNSEHGGWELELIRVLNHVDGAREDGANVAAGISCILPLPQTVYTGDEDGRVCEWTCVQRH